jgi:hypothetical protein
MSDPNALNNPELERLERRLSRTTWSPTATERECLLYACGQAAGRAQMMQKVRGVTVIAALLGCVCAGLGFALLQREQSPIAVVNRAPSQSSADLVAASQRDGLPNDESSEVMSSQRAELSVSANFAELALSDRGPGTSTSHGAALTLTTESVLSASGPLSGAL